MRSSLKFLIVAILMAVAPSVNAGGGHVVRNGGGVAELKLTEVWQSLAGRFTPHFSGDQCESILKEQAAIKALSEYQKSCHSELKFSDHMSQVPFQMGACGKPLIVNSSFLYMADDKPIDDDSIYKFAINMFFALSDLSASPIDAISSSAQSYWTDLLLKTNWTMQLNFEEEAQWLVFQEQTIGSQFYITCGKKRVYLDDMFAKRFNCQNPTSLDVEVEMSMGHPSGAKFINGTAKMQCSDGSKRKRYRMQLSDETCPVKVRLSLW